MSNKAPIIIFICILCLVMAVESIDNRTRTNQLKKETQDLREDLNEAEGRLSILTGNLTAEIANRETADNRQFANNALQENTILELIGRQPPKPVGNSKVDFQGLPEFCKGKTIREVHFEVTVHDTDSYTIYVYFKDGSGFYVDVSKDAVSLGRKWEADASFNNMQKAIEIMEKATKDVEETNKIIERMTEKLKGTN